jgi:hypothetical protein
MPSHADFAKVGPQPKRAIPATALLQHAIDRGIRRFLVRIRPLVAGELHHVVLKTMNRKER